MAAFNRFPGPREIVHGPTQDHDWNRDGENGWPVRQEWLKRFAR